ncbi:hypothetical protein JCM1840_007282 [Sporobolomyces johnsonii]
MELLRILFTMPSRVSSHLGSDTSQSPSSHVSLKRSLTEANAASPLHALDALGGDNATPESRAKRPRQTAPEDTAFIARACARRKSARLAERAQKQADMNKRDVPVAVPRTSPRLAPKFAKPAEPAELNKSKPVDLKKRQSSSLQASSAQPAKRARTSSCTSPTARISRVTALKSASSPARRTKKRTVDVAPTPPKAHKRSLEQDEDEYEVAVDRRAHLMELDLKQGKGKGPATEKDEMRWIHEERWEVVMSELLKGTIQLSPPPAVSPIAIAITTSLEQSDTTSATGVASQDDKEELTNVQPEPVAEVIISTPPSTPSTFSTFSTFSAGTSPFASVTTPSSKASASPQPAPPSSPFSAFAATSGFASTTKGVGASSLFSARPAAPSAFASNSSTFTFASTASAFDSDLADEKSPDSAGADHEVATGEEDDEVVHRTRARLYQLHDGNWAERGMGPLTLNTTSGAEREKAAARIVMRADATHRLVLNASLFPDFFIEVSDGKFVRFTAIDGAEPISYMLKLKNSAAAQELVDAVREQTTAL